MALALFAIWLGLVLYLSLHYVVGRDDVRALTLALQGNGVIAMLKGLHGEGHPAIWYLLLRGGHAIWARPQILKVVSIVVAAAAALLLLLKSPFRLPLVALILAGHLTLIEYSVVPRNYGIAMLLLFIFAAIYERHRDRDCLPGVVLLLLANCHPLAVLLAGALLLFWLLDILGDPPADRPRAFKMFLLNTVIATVGVVLCVLTILPTFNDAAVVERPDGITLRSIAKAVFLPALQFRDFILPGFYKLVAGKMSILFSLIMFGSTLGLIRRMGAFVAALLTLVGLSVFFALISPGSYRHEALWLVMLIGMYWLTAAQNTHPETAFPARIKPFVQPVSRIGWALFLLILLLQVPPSIHQLIRTFHHGIPSGRSRDLGALVMNRPDLHDAIIIADPDYLLEPLPYYLPNQTYLMREQRFGNVVHFTRKARLQMDLSDILANARRLHAETGKPIVILLEQRLNASAPAEVDKEGYDWKLTTTPEEVRDFQASTQLIESFGPATSEETFDVYTLN